MVCISTPELPFPATVEQIVSGAEMVEGFQRIDGHFTKARNMLRLSLSRRLDIGEYNEFVDYVRDVATHYIGGEPDGYVVDFRPESMSPPIFYPMQWVRTLVPERGPDSRQRSVKVKYDPVEMSLRVEPHPMNPDYAFLDIINESLG